MEWTAIKRMVIYASLSIFLLALFLCSIYGISLAFCPIVLFFLAKLFDPVITCSAAIFSHHHISSDFFYKVH